MMQNNLLLIVGSLVGTSGAILTYVPERGVKTGPPPASPPPSFQSPVPAPDVHCHEPQHYQRPVWGLCPGGSRHAVLSIRNLTSK